MSIDKSAALLPESHQAKKKMSFEVGGEKTEVEGNPIRVDDSARRKPKKLHEGH